MYRANKQLTPGTLACRVCLVTTGKMFCLETCGLREAFFDITGIQVSLGDGLPQHVCYACCGLLRKAMEFRNKSRSTQSLLSNIPLTLDLMQQINSMHGQQLIRTNVIYISIGEEKIELNDVELKEDLKDAESAFCDNEYSSNAVENDLRGIENSISNRIESGLNEFLTFHQNNEELTETNNLSDCEESKDDLTPLLTLQSDLKIKKRKIITKKLSTPNRDLPDRAKTQSVIKSPYYDLHKKELYRYITAKYINKTWDGGLVKNEDKSESELIVTTKTDPKVIKFYVYLRDHYGYVDAERDLDIKIPIVDAVVKKTNKVALEPKKKQIYAANMVMEFGNKYNFKVVTFSREEQIKNMRERMETDRYRNAQYKCEDCYTGFRYKHKYITHKAKHDPAISGNFECDACKFRFRSTKSYFNHVRTRHKYKYICKDCDKSFYCRYHAIHHYKMHNGSAGYQCNYCSAVFRWASTYNNHKRGHHGTMFCDICHVGLTPAGLSHHMRLQHKTTYKCQSCEKIFNDPAALEKHINTSLNEVCNANNWPCTKCGENFTSESHLNEHISKLRPHLIPGRRNWNAACETIENKTYCALGKRKGNDCSLMCESCGRTFQAPSQLREHMRIHTGDKPFVCPTCSKSYRLKILLEMHIRTHRAEKPYKCPDCQKAFKWPGNARKHQLSVHQNVRRHTCEICSKSFFEKSAVNIHIRTVHMKIPMPPRIRNKKRKIEDPVEEKIIMIPKEGKRVVDTKTDEKIDDNEEDRTGDSEEALIMEDCDENDRVEFLEEWPDD